MKPGPNTLTDPGPSSVCGQHRACWMKRINTVAGGPATPAPPSAHQSGCLTPPSFHEAPPASRQHPQMPPWVQVPSHDIVCLVSRPDPSESPHVTRLCRLGPGHDLSRWQFPVLPPHKEWLHLGFRGRRSRPLLRRGLYVNARLRSHGSIGPFAASSLLVLAGGHSVAKVFPDRKLSNGRDCSGKRSQEEEAE